MSDSTEDVAKADATSAGTSENGEGESTEDKIAWLRARGVTIDIPGERKPKQQSTTDDKEGGYTFAYVRIPADTSEPFQQLEGKGRLAADNMLTILKPHFAGGGSIDADSARQQAIAQVGDQGRLLGATGLASLGAAAEEGVVETFALVRPASTNKNCGIYIYLDEVGLLKKRPLNPRAGELAKTCGFDGASFYGDVFVGRTQIRPPPMRNIDFTLEDMSSSAAWLKRAAAENYDYNLGMREIQDAIQEKGGTVPGKGDGEMEGGGGAYKWSQTDEDVEITYPVAEDAKSKEVKVIFGARSVSICVREQKLDLTLFAPVRPDECSWTLSKGVVTITMEKVNEGRWPTVDGS